MESGFLFPFKRTLSLKPLIAWWTSALDSESPAVVELARTVLSQVERNPEISEDGVSPYLLRSTPDPVRALLAAVFPMAGDRHDAMAAIPPFTLISILSTSEFERLSLLPNFSYRARVNGVAVPEERMNAGRVMMAYHTIYRTFYGDEIDPMSFVVGTTDPDTGLDRFMQTEIDSRFMEVRAEGELPVLTKEDRTRLLSDCGHLDLWQQLLPPEKFSFYGLSIMRCVDVTRQQVSSMLKNDLLDPDAFSSPEMLDRLEWRIRTILRRPSLRLGLIAVDDNDDIQDASPLGRSLLICDGDPPDCPRRGDSTYARVLRSGEPVIVEDLDGVTDGTGYESFVAGRGFRCLLVYPLIHEGEVIGLFELASERIGDVTSQTIFQLAEVVSLFATALRRGLSEREHRIQSMIKRRYTAIHPVVEWRFRETASLFLLDDGPEVRKVEQQSLVFENVHPLFGLADIRNSSVIRSNAIHADMVDQLGMALAAVIEASSVRAQPALDELGYRLARFIDDLRSGEPTGEESEPLVFLQAEVEPVLERIASIDPAVADRVQTYRNALDPRLGFVYGARRSFDEAVTRLNDVIAQFIEDRDREAQDLVPHYFERYRTDGVDYNLYAGASLVKDQTFDDLHLRDLRLWQLMTTAGLVWEIERVRPELPISLEVAHLVLVQSAPLSIRFRLDEKRFDVDGAYNARYEILKKRIDKATVRGQKERLTQPGRIAVVYSQPSEVAEYRRYISYLNAAGYLEDDVEDLELDPQQGVTGLRALRVSVRPQAPRSEVLVEFVGSRGSGNMDD